MSIDSIDPVAQRLAILFSIEYCGELKQISYAIDSEQIYVP